MSNARDPQSPKLYVARYGLSLAAVALGFTVRSLVAGQLGNYFPYLLFYPAIMLAARFGGFGPGVASTLLSALIAAYFYMEPGHSFYIPSVADRVSLPVFFGFGLLISWSSESLRQAEARQRELAALQLGKLRPLMLARAPRDESLPHHLAEKGARIEGLRGGQLLE